MCRADEVERALAYLTDPHNNRFSNCSRCCCRARAAFC